MRTTAIVLLLLAACERGSEPSLTASCTLVQTGRIEGLEAYPEYVSCIEADTGERFFFLWSDIQPVMASGGHAGWDWVNEHRLPDEWFDPEGLPVEGAFG